MAKVFNDLALVEEYKKCNKCRVVAEKYGCSDETVRRALIKYDIPRVKRNPRPTTRPRATKEELRQIVKEYYATDLTINDLTKKYHRSQYTISAAIQKYGNGYKPCLVNNTKITDEQILEAVKTMTRQEIANLYGVHVENLARRMRKLGVHAVRSIPKKKKRADEWHWTQGCADFVERCQNGRFELVEFKGGRVRIRCKKCGAIVERSRSTIRKKNVACDGCKQHEEEKQAREAFVKTLAKIAEYQKEKICPVCGSVFHSHIPNQKYCSYICKRKSKGRRSSYRSRARKYGTYYDPSVTREAVIERDNMVCQICGKVCDPNDKSWGSSGPDYPTLDHIVPLAAGGSHTWGNVQCACGMCNSTKRDLLNYDRKGA